MYYDFALALYLEPEGMEFVTNEYLTRMDRQCTPPPGIGLSP